jgi:hypothetical protein
VRVVVQLALATRTGHLPIDSSVLEKAREMHRSRDLVAFVLLTATVFVFAVGCSGEESASTAWVGDAPYGRLPDGTPDNEKVNPKSFGPAESIEWNTAVVGCLNDAGFNAVLDGDGRFGLRVTDIPPEQEPAYQAANEACLELHPNTAPTELTDAEWQHMYEATLRHADCLRQRGLAIPEAPSASVWIESKGAAWSPSAAFLDIDDAKRAQLLTLCPSPG